MYDFTDAGQGSILLRQCKRRCKAFGLCGVFLFLLFQGTGVCGILEGVAEIIFEKQEAVL